jgi:hypothetical protein
MSDAPVDQTVYLHFDGDRKVASWRIADYDGRGIFTSAQKTDLTARFGLPAALVSRLSLYVGNILDADSLMNLTRVSRSKATEAATTALRRAVRHARQDGRFRDELAKVILTCSAQFADVPSDATLLFSAQAIANDPKSGLTDLLDAASAVLTRPGSASLLAPADRRKLWDGRREHIVRNCCYVWLDAGRPLTYTTRADRLSSEQREGPLFDLIRTVMGMVICEGKPPGDEAIRKDIDRFRDLITRHPELLDGR